MTHCCDSFARLSNWSMLKVFRVLSLTPCFCEFV